MEEYWLWFLTRKTLYRPQQRELLRAFCTPKGVFEAKEEELERLKGLSPSQRAELLGGKREWNPEKYAHGLDARGIRFISREHPKFPERLKEIPDPPFGLFVKGALPRPDIPAAAIIGARSCSLYGKEKAAELGSFLAENGIQVISGMALGIDGAAQWAALEAKGKSFAVLGCGADICYPKSNRSLYERLASEGGILTEYPPGTQPLAMHFPVRNRIISGLSDCVAVVEAREKSGSLITADLALDQGKEVFAVPGRMEDPLSRGCNRLIAQGAGILWEKEELLYACGQTPGAAGKKEIPKLVLEKKENMVYSVLDFHSRSLEEIVEDTGLLPQEAMAAVVSLKLLGAVKETAKNYYAKLF